MPKTWMVRAGRGARWIDDFVERRFVGIGGTELGEIDAHTSKQEILRRYREVHAQESEGALAVWASQIRRFFGEIRVGDGVVTYDSDKRVYLMGTIQGDVHRADHELGFQRPVEWTGKVGRDSLNVQTRNCLGAISSLFLIPADAADEMRSKVVPLSEPAVEIPPTAEREADRARDEKVLLDEVVNKAQEFIEDRIARLDWQQMQELVAGLLEAMGYRSRVSDPGSDRGVDVFASPDGLGLEEPRIFVEVKHRPGNAIGAQEVRAFLGGRQAGDRCLYVSTGGFTREARYEADRASVPLRLLTLADLRELLTELYPKLEASVAALVPLERIYWPTR